MDGDEGRERGGEKDTFVAWGVCACVSVFRESEKRERSTDDSMLFDRKMVTVRVSCPRRGERDMERMCKEEG